MSQLPNSLQDIFVIPSIFMWTVKLNFLPCAQVSRIYAENIKICYQDNFVTKKYR